MRLLLTHVPLARRQYYGARALARLQELVEVVLHEGDASLDPQGVIDAAREVDLIIADRATPVPGEIFAGLPKLKVMMRSAIDIRNIDVAAASKAGVLVTHAEAGFVQSVVELTLGFLVDLIDGDVDARHALDNGEPLGDLDDGGVVRLQNIEHEPLDVRHEECSAPDRNERASDPGRPT